MRRGRPPYANDPAARQRSDAFFEEMPAPRASTNAASRLASVLGGRARSRDPSPSARRVPKHAVAFGTTVRSPRVSPHVTPRATPRSSPRNPASAAWTASDRYLARVRERERDVRRDDEGDGELLSDENRSDLYELSDDSIDDHLGAVFPSHASSRRSRRARSPGRSMSPGPRSLGTSPGGDGRVDRRARSGEAKTARLAMAAARRRRRRRRERAAARRVRPGNPQTFSAVPEPRRHLRARPSRRRVRRLCARLPRNPSRASGGGGGGPADDASAPEDGASSKAGAAWTLPWTLPWTPRRRLRAHAPLRSPRVRGWRFRALLVARGRRVFGPTPRVRRRLARGARTDEPATRRGTGDASNADRLDREERLG